MFNSRFKQSLQGTLHTELEVAGTQKIKTYDLVLSCQTDKIDTCNFFFELKVNKKNISYIQI